MSVWITCLRENSISLIYEPSFLWMYEIANRHIPDQHKERAAETKLCDIAEIKVNTLGQAPAKRSQPTAIRTSPRKLGAKKAKVSEEGKIAKV